MCNINRVSFATILGFLLGVGINSGLGWYSSGFIFIPGTFIVISLLGSFLKVVRPYMWVFIFITAFLFGMMYIGYVLDRDHHDAQRAAFFVDEDIAVTGVVVRDPDKRASNKKVVIKVEEFAGVGSRLDVRGVNVLLTLERHDDIMYGDMITVRGKLLLPENFITDTGREFDYKNFLAKDDIFYQMFYPDIEVIDVDHGSRITSWMLSLKHMLVASINRIFAQPEGALLAGELFGEKSALDGDLQDAFRRTGVIHIVVLSGFNITIVALFMVWLLKRFLHPRAALFFGIAGIVLFALLVGGGATVIRASIMAILVIVARLIGRDYDVTRALFIAAFFMIIQNPKILVFDISFQLSFLATLSLIYIAPYIEKKLRWVTSKFELRETLVQTLSAQVFVLPLLLYSIGEFSIVSVIVNVLVVPLVPMTMFAGFLSGLVGLISQTLASIIMVPAYVLLKLQILFVEFFNKLSFAAVNVPQISVWFVLILYTAAFCWVARQYRQRSQSKIVDSSSKLAAQLQKD